MRTVIAVGLMVLCWATPAIAQSNDEADVRAVVQSFGKALAGGDSAAVLALLHPDVVIFEAGGWESLEDYRKGHLRADINAVQSLKQETLRDVIRVSGDMALSTREYSTTGQRGERTVNNVGAESMVLLKTPTGWKIRHIHWSSRARRPAC